MLVLVITGVDIDRDEREADRSPTPEDVEHLHERPAILSTGQPDHHAVAVCDQIERADGPPDFAGQFGFELGAVSH